MEDEKEFEDILFVLRSIRNHTPGLRFCQILKNAVSVYDDTYYLSDDKLLVYLKEYLAVVNKRNNHVS